MTICWKLFPEERLIMENGLYVKLNLSVQVITLSIILFRISGGQIRIDY